MEIPITDACRRVAFCLYLTRCLSQASRTDDDFATLVQPRYPRSYHSILADPPENRQVRRVKRMHEDSLEHSRVVFARRRIRNYNLTSAPNPQDMTGSVRG